MIVLSVSRRRSSKAKAMRRLTGILARLSLPQGFQTVCGVLKAAATAVLLGAIVLPAHGQALRVQEMIITDPWTGAAIGGFDPVAYFIEKRPVAGSAAHLAVYAGVAWHFQSESNRAAFLESPDTYRPAFGGYDPVMVASGVPVAGQPDLFAIIDGRLHLFRRTENRALFLENPAVQREAQKLWPELQRQLSP